MFATALATSSDAPERQRARSHQRRKGAAFVAVGIVSLVTPLRVGEDAWQAALINHLDSVRLWLLVLSDSTDTDALGLFFFPALQAVFLTLLALLCAVTGGLLLLDRVAPTRLLLIASLLWFPFKVVTDVVGAWTMRALEFWEVILRTEFGLSTFTAYLLVPHLLVPLALVGISLAGRLGKPTGGEGNHWNPVVDAQLSRQQPFAASQPASPGMRSAAQWTVNVPGQRSQSVDTVTLQAWASSRVIEPDSMVLDADSGITYAAKQIPGVFSDKSFTTTLLLSLFLGYLGVDRFYLGQTGLGIAKLLTAGGCGVWALVDFLLIAMRKVTDSQGRPLA